MKNRASTRFTVIAYTLTALAVCFAFVHSMMPSEISGDESQGVLDIINSILGFFGLSPSEDEHLVRKIAHFSEFTAIGGIMTVCAYSRNKDEPYRYYAYVFFFGLLCAVCDETIQLNVPGRAGLVTDVLIDFSGVLTGFCAVNLFFLIRRRIKNRNNKAD